MSTTALDPRIEYLEDGLRDILDVCTGWTRNMEHEEQIATIKLMAEKLLGAAA